jgi:DNA-binding NarL/FixJ family response regulator
MAITVLVADDHAVVREGLATLIGAQPDLRVVGTCADGLEAVRAAARLLPDVVVIDLAMPRMNGLEAAREIHARAPHTRVVVLSMYSSAEHVFHALQAGAAGYVLKEAASQELLAAVRAVHSGRRYLSPRIRETVAGLVGAGGLAKSPLARLSRRERQILQLVAEGHSSVRIAELLHLSPKTVDTYRSRLMHKLQIADTASLIRFAIVHGLTPLE